MAEAALRVRDLAVTLGERAVLHGVSLAAHAGEVLSVLGPNGAGKSTLLRAICGLLPALGTITIDGASPHGWTPVERARRLSFVPQQSQLRAALPVREVVALGRYAHAFGRRRTDEDVAAIEAAMRDTDVTALASRPFTDLSSGEQKRVLLARALATGAPILLLDEPTAALDIAHALGLLQALRALARRGRTVVIVLHQLEHALTHADRALLLDRGRVLAEGPVADVVTAAHVRALYGVAMIDRDAPGFRLAGTEAP